MHGDRVPTELFHDILLAIHQVRKSGERPTLSRIGRNALVSNNRLRERLAELVALGLVDGTLTITRRGYDYLIDYQKHVEPFLSKYGLDRHA
jgi:hypothetical protein